jgi:hypothetical protein
MEKNSIRKKSKKVSTSMIDTLVGRGGEGVFILPLPTNHIYDDTSVLRLKKREEQDICNKGVDGGDLSLALPSSHHQPNYHHH